MIRILLSIVLALSTTGAHATQAGNVRARDDLGRTIELPRPARRIATLSPHATELVVEAGAGDELVAVAVASASTPRIDTLPKIGGPGPLNRELLMALRPDLVIAWYSGNRNSDLAWLDTIGIPVYLSEPATLDHVANSIRAIGELTGHESLAKQSAARFERRSVTPCFSLPELPAYVSIWDHPTMSVGGRHWLNDVLQASGYRNALRGVELGVFAISTEAAYQFADVSRIDLQRAFNGSEADELADLLSRPGPRLADAVSLLCKRRLGQK